MHPQMCHFKFISNRPVKLENHGSIQTLESSLISENEYGRTIVGYDLIKPKLPKALSLDHAAMEYCQ